MISVTRRFTIISLSPAQKNGTEFCDTKYICAYIVLGQPRHTITQTHIILCAHAHVHTIHERVHFISSSTSLVKCTFQLNHAREKKHHCTQTPRPRNVKILLDNVLLLLLLLVPLNIQYSFTEVFFCCCFLSIYNFFLLLFVMLMFLVLLLLRFLLLLLLPVFSFFPHKITTLIYQRWFVLTVDEKKENKIGIKQKNICICLSVCIIYIMFIYVFQLFSNFSR